MPRLIKTTFEVVSHESAENGDFEGMGWEDETGYPIEPDEYDLDEYGSELEAVAAMAADYILDNGPVQPSSSEYGPRLWYTATTADQNYATGDSIYYSYHLDGFTEAESRAVFSLIRGR